MKAHVARNQNAGVPMVITWNVYGGDRGKLDGMAAAFGMKCRPVRPEEAGMTVAQLLGDAAPVGREQTLPPESCPPAILLANFAKKDADTLLDLLEQAEFAVPMRSIVTKETRGLVFADLLQAMLREYAQRMQAQQK